MIFRQVGGSIAGKHLPVGKQRIGCPILIHLRGNTPANEFVKREPAMAGSRLSFLSKIFRKWYGYIYH